MKAAKSVGYETGGWMPNGCRTEHGDKPEYIDLYGMKMTRSANYQTRTSCNILESDLTLLLYRNLKSPGTELTVRLARANNKRLLMVRLENKTWDIGVLNLSQTIHGFDPKIINVAGNRESQAPGIQKCAEFYLRRVLRTLKEGVM